MANSKIQLYQSADGRVRLDVSLEQESVWLSQAQLATLFGIQRPAITKHLSNIFKSGELNEQVVCSILEHTTAHGAIAGKTQTKGVKFYNLDAIISVGYRVNSARATQFRIWATDILRQHLVQGYSLNQTRLQERGIELEQVVGLLSQTLENQQLVSAEGAAVLSVVSDYARSWSLLQGYDEQSLCHQTSKQSAMKALVLGPVLEAVSSLKKTLMEKGEATELFGQLHGGGLESAISTIEQGFGDELFYPNVASRAAHLLYFVIKNHPLADGNKRTGSFLFLWYLRINQSLLAKPVEALINDNTLVALALLVAESKPDQKELIIRLIQQFILLLDN